MEMTSDIVGLRSRCCETELTWRQTMNYAAAVGDSNPWYLDDQREGGIIAPPMLSVALTWPLLERYPEFWGDHVPIEIIQRQVHYTERLIWRRPMRPGDKLSIQGELVAIQPHRGGTLMSGCYTATDASGEVVFEEYGGALLRGVRCVDGGRVLRPLPTTPNFPDTGEILWERVVPIDPLAAHVYDGCTNIVFPIHTSVQFARFVGLPGTILHGTATLSIAVREIVNTEAGADPTRLESVSCCFTGMVVPGTQITLRVKAKSCTAERTEIFFDVLNGAGKRALSDGYVLIRI